MNVLKEGGNLLYYFCFSYHILDFYLPPKRDMNFFFIKQVLSAKKKVRYILYYPLHNLINKAFQKL